MVSSDSIFFDSIFQNAVISRVSDSIFSSTKSTGYQKMPSRKQKCRHGFWKMPSRISKLAQEPRRVPPMNSDSTAFLAPTAFFLKFEKMPSVWRKCRQLEENAVTFTKCRQFEKNAVSSQQIVISRKHDTGSQEILTHQVHLSSKRRNAYHITFAISTRTM